MRAAFLALMLLIGLAVDGWTALAQDGATTPGSPRMTAHPVEASITVDGRLDEDAWQEAESISGFRQLEPLEGAPASQEAEIRILYDDNSLYLGAFLYDEPELVSARLARRDNINQADWLIVAIDSQYDQRTAFIFGVNAAGVQYDALRTEGGGGGPGSGGDDSWDAIWESGVELTSEGWTVEMRIPYSMLRFSSADEQIWGVHFTRRIPRLGEVAEWPLVPRSERSNLVAGYGRLDGIRNVEARRTVQVRPYTVSRLHMEEHATEPGTLTREASIDAGGDLKIGISSNLTLDMTVNPDFGQVEADPAVLNLTAFETFFDERRPFFIEGTQIYDFELNRSSELLYTRRIGAFAPIVGAAKLSSQTGGGTSFGLLGATTGHRFTPNRSYGAARLSQQFGHSMIGGMITGYDAPADGGQRRSIVGGLDWDLRFQDNTYDLVGYVTFSYDGLSTTSGGAGTGWAAMLEGSRRRGIWTYEPRVEVYSNRFDPNDVGRLQRNNYIRASSFVAHDISGGQPFGPFQRANARFNVGQEWSYSDGLNLGMDVFVSTDWTFHNFTSLDLGFRGEHLFGGYDLFETRGLGPWKPPRELQADVGLRTDQRRSWQLEPEVEVAFLDDGGRNYSGSLELEWNITSALNIETEVGGEWERNVTAWSSNETLIQTDGAWHIGTESTSPPRLEPGDFVEFDDGGILDDALAPIEPFDADGHYFVPIFGSRDTRAMDMTLRGTLTFTPRLSVQLYGQLFVARGRYDSFQLMQGRDTLVPFDAFPKRDEFSLSSLQTNAVLRWEYLPGSNLYLVWTHGRRDNDQLNPLAPWGDSPYNTPLDSQIAETFGIIPSNTLLVKLEYTFLR